MYPTGKASKLTIGVVFLLLFGGGIFVGADVDDTTDYTPHSVTVCEGLEEHDFEQMVHRVGKIKDMKMARNLTVCTERSAGEVDLTSDERRFAYLRAPELAFFDLEPRTGTGKRTSLGYTTLPLDDDRPIKIVLANESVVKDATWVSYEALIAHELSHAIENSHFRHQTNVSNRQARVARTTDWLLANRALSEGTATYVSERYVQRYGGRVNVSKLGSDNRGWKHHILVSVYSEGYRYSKHTRTTSVGMRRVNSTAEILHPKQADSANRLLSRTNVSIRSLEHVRDDRVGELFVREVFELNGLTTARARTAAEGWVNDRLDYYRGDEFEVVTWRVVWQTEDDRNEFLSAYRATYNYTKVPSVQTIDCNSPGRYLVTSQKTITVVSCRN